jgi:ankyrin repeat protein
VLYRASALGTAALVRVLLERGADPNDGESVYHAAEHDHRAVLELLVRHGAEISARHPRWNNTVLYFLVGHSDDAPGAPAAAEGMRWLLEHGADPNVTSYDSREMPLHRVADFGRGAALAELLLAHGADPARPRADGRTPCDLALRVGNRPVLELLRARGAAGEPRPLDAFFGACAEGQVDEARRIRDAHPGLLESLPPEERNAVSWAVRNGRAVAVRALAALGFDVGLEGSAPGTPLHWVSWYGKVEMVRVLLELGAPINVRDRQYGSSPIAWAAHGSRYARRADDDYLAIVDLLVDAGSERSPSFNRWGEPPEALASEAVAEQLRARGFAPQEDGEPGAAR